MDKQKKKDKKIIIARKIKKQKQEQKVSQVVKIVINEPKRKRVKKSFTGKEEKAIKQEPNKIKESFNQQSSIAPVVRFYVPPVSQSTAPALYQSPNLTYSTGVKKINEDFTPKKEAEQPKETPKESLKEKFDQITQVMPERFSFGSQASPLMTTVATEPEETTEASQPVKGQIPPPGWDEAMQRTKETINLPEGTPEEPQEGVPGESLDAKFKFLKSYARERLREMVTLAYESELTTGKTGQPKKIFNNKTKSADLVAMLEAKVKNIAELDFLFNKVRAERT